MHHAYVVTGEIPGACWYFRGGRCSCPAGSHASGARSGRHTEHAQRARSRRVGVFEAARHCAEHWRIRAKPCVLGQGAPSMAAAPHNDTPRLTRAPSGERRLPTTSPFRCSSWTGTCSTPTYKAWSTVCRPLRRQASRAPCVARSHSRPITRWFTAAAATLRAPSGHTRLVVVVIAGAAGPNRGQGLLPGVRIQLLWHHAGRRRRQRAGTLGCEWCWVG